MVDVQGSPIFLPLTLPWCNHLLYPCTLSLSLPLQVVTLFAHKGVRGDLSDHQLSPGGMGRGLWGGVNTGLTVPSLLGERQVGVPLGSITLLALLVDTHQRMSLQKERNEKTSFNEH